MTGEWRMQLIGPGTQEEKESWHEVGPTTLADCTGSKPCTPKPHLLSGPKKNTCFFLCSFSQYEDWYATHGEERKKKKSFCGCTILYVPLQQLYSGLWYFLFQHCNFLPEMTREVYGIQKPKQKGEKWKKHNSTQWSDSCKEKKSNVCGLWPLEKEKNIYVGQKVTANKY